MTGKRTPTSGPVSATSSDGPEATLRKFRIMPAHVLLGVLAYLALGWAAFLLVDGRNLLGLRDALAAGPMANPVLWYHLFQEGGLTEILQWLFLGTAAVTAAFLAGRLSGRGYGGPAWFWLLMGFAFILMLIEDAGNPRHLLAKYARLLFGESTTVTMATEIAFFAVVAAFPLVALWRFGQFAWQSRNTRNYLLLGFLAYAAAVIASATRSINWWYTTAGAFLHQTLAGGDLMVPPRWEGNAWLMHFYLMDWVVEESVELLGAAAFLAAALAFSRHWEKEPDIGRSPYGSLPALFLDKPRRRINARRTDADASRDKAPEPPSD